MKTFIEQGIVRNKALYATRHCAQAFQCSCVFAVSVYEYI